MPQAQPRDATQTGSTPKGFLQAASPTCPGVPTCSVPGHPKAGEAGAPSTSSKPPCQAGTSIFRRSQQPRPCGSVRHGTGQGADGNTDSLISAFFPDALASPAPFPLGTPPLPGWLSVVGSRLSCTPFATPAWPWAASLAQAEPHVSACTNFPVLLPAPDSFLRG